MTIIYSFIYAFNTPKPLTIELFKYIQKAAQYLKQQCH